METFENIRRMIDFSDSYEKAQKSRKNGQKFSRPFSIEIRTISPIISLKYAEFVALTGIVVLGGVWHERLIEALR